MNGILGSYNLYSNVTQSVAQCSTEKYSSVTLNLCNRSNVETCYVDIAITTTESVINNNSRYVEYNTRVAPNTSFQREGILVSAGEFVTLVYRGEEPRCLTASVWGIESGEDQGLAEITLVRDAAPVITTTTLPDAEQGLNYSQQIVATDNREIVSYTIASGSLPTGLSLDQTTGLITGAPTGANQDYTFTVRVTDNTDEFTDQELTITKTPDTTGPVFTTTELDIEFAVGKSSSFTFTADDASTPVTFSVTDGSLPTGVTLQNTGVLDGTPATGQEGDYTFTVTASDTAGNTSDLTFELVVNSTVTQNLRSYLLASDTNSYPGTGTTWFDLSGNNFDGTLRGSTAFDSNDSSISLGTTANTSNYITIPINALQNATEFTVDLWLQRDVANSDLDSFFTMGSGNHMLMYQRASNGNIAFENTGASNFSGASFVNGEVTNLVFRGSSGTISLYKDNTLIGTSPNTTTINGNSSLGIVLGQEMDSSGGNFQSTQNFRGRYFEIKLYDRALTTDELDTNYAVSSSRYS